MKALRTVQAPAVDAALVKAVDDAVIDLTEVEADRADTVLGHDPRDFASLYLRYRAPLTKRAGRFLSDARDVDEVVQETFLKVFLALPELDTELAAVRFAHRVLANMCIDRYRSESRRPGMLDLELVVHNLAEDLPDDPLIRAEDAAIVREALAQLTPEHRAALIKREIEEKPLSVIAAEIGVPEDQVKHLLFRARRSLRRILVGSSVDPTVDLSTGEVLDLTGHRLAAAAGSTAVRGTAIVVVLLVAIGWVLGGSAFPAGHHGTPVVNGGPQLGLVAPSAPRGGSTHRTLTGGRSQHSAAQHRGAGRTATAEKQGHTPAHHPTVGLGTPGGGHTTPPTSPTTSPPPTSPPPVRPPATAKFAVSGLLSSQHGAVQNQSRVVRGPNRYQSSANFVAPTTTGRFEMAQVIDFTTLNGVPTVNSVALNPVIPIGQFGAGYVTTGNPVVTVRPIAAGYDVTVASVAVPVSTDGADQLAVTLHATYDPTLTQISAEQVTLGVAGPSVSPTPGDLSPGPQPSDPASQFGLNSLPATLSAVIDS